MPSTRYSSTPRAGSREPWAGALPASPEPPGPAPARAPPATAGAPSGWWTAASRRDWCDGARSPGAVPTGPSAGPPAHYRGAWGPRRAWRAPSSTKPLTTQVPALLGVTPSPPAPAPPATGQRAQGCWPDPAGTRIPSPGCHGRDRGGAVLTRVLEHPSRVLSQQLHHAEAAPLQPARGKRPPSARGRRPPLGGPGHLAPPSRPAESGLPGPSWHQSLGRAAGLPLPHPRLPTPEPQGEKGSAAGHGGPGHTEGGLRLGEETPQQRGQRSPRRQCRSPASERGLRAAR